MPTGGPSGETLVCFLQQCTDNAMKAPLASEEGWRLRGAWDPRLSREISRRLQLQWRQVLIGRLRM